MSEDVFPRKNDEFDEFFRFMNQYVSQRCSGNNPEWTHIPQEARTIMMDTYALWYTAYSKTKGPHTPVDTQGRNEARKMAQAKIRPFINQYLRFPPVTDQDRSAMGIHNHDTVRSEIQPPRTAPELIPDTGTRRRLIVQFRDEGSTRRGKPKHVVGVAVLWAILDRPPVSIETDLVHTSFGTKSPLILEFDESDRGKHVYMSGCWEIHRDALTGPFGAIVEAIIP
jgi:hypothetical protein